jgi:hypothetical protein
MEGELLLPVEPGHRLQVRLAIEALNGERAGGQRGIVRRAAGGQRGARGAQDERKRFLENMSRCREASIEGLSAAVVPAKLLTPEPKRSLAAG